MPSIRENVERGLRHLGVEHLVSILRASEDRVYGLPWGAVEVEGEVARISQLERYCRDNGWQRDTSRLMKRWHRGGVASYRESDGCRPAMQIVFLANGECEIDFDYWSPVDVVGIFGHFGEVLANKLRRKKTDQAKVAAMLDKRFGEREVVA